MKAIITSYKPGDYNDAHIDIMSKDILEYTQWLLRAGQRGYVALQNNDTGNLFLITEQKGLRDFEIRFEN